MYNVGRVKIVKYDDDDDDDVLTSKHVAASYIYIYVII